jgi:dipeptidyl-peptidase 4
VTSTAPDPGFPRQQAVTRRFRLGLPRAFRISPSGDLVAFIRSAGGRDPEGSLWVAEADGKGGLHERMVVDATVLVRPDGNLPAAEQARRERMRETTSGITAFSVDYAVKQATFAVDGVPYLVDLRDGAAIPIVLPHPGAIVDPRLSSDGGHVAFVSDRSVYAVSTSGDTPPVALCLAQEADESWGLADFIAAEELDRARGLWWLAGGEALLVEHVDESEVAIRWISDPAQPERTPLRHRYPVAGSANPVARLYRVSLDARRTEIAWDRDAYPYLATVEPDSAGGAVVSVLSRDQRRQLILDVAPDGSTTIARERRGQPWLTMQVGVPCRGADGSLLEIVANLEDDCFQLVADDRPVTPATLQVTGVIDVSPERIVITAQGNALEQHVLVIDALGTVTSLTRGESFNQASASTGGLVIASSDSTRLRTRFDARLTAGAYEVASLAETPTVEPVIYLRRVTDRQLQCALLLPTGHLPGSGMLPVVMAPYGGPHHARVVHAASAFAADQWLADQGFAVLVVDGAGTPGRGPGWEYGIRHDLASVVLGDQVAALKAMAIEYPDLDLGRVGITGWSFGGYLAALAVLDRPDVFRAAVAGAPVSDWRLYDTAYSERYLGLPQDDPDVYDAASLLTRASKLARPLLLIHGLADDNVLAANTLTLSGALLAAGRPHSFLPLSGVTHMTPQTVVAENLMRLELDFLRDHLA